MNVYWHISVLFVEIRAINFYLNWFSVQKELILFVSQSDPVYFFEKSMIFDLLYPFFRS
jgi:hypothetical protein